MSAKTAFRAFVDRAEFPHDDHRGEPYQITECPWCGLALRGCEDEEGG